MLFLILWLMFTNSYGQISQGVAKKIMGDNFIIDQGCDQKVKIPFSEKILKSDCCNMLIEKKENGKHVFFLIGLFKESISEDFLEHNDTASLEESKGIIKDLNCNQSIVNRDIESKIFFRIKDASSKGPNFRKAFCYIDNNNFMIIDWPNMVDLGIINKNYISYLDQSNNGLGFIFLPEYNILSHNKSIKVLTIYKNKNDQL